MNNIISKKIIISITLIFTVSMLSGCNINEGKTDINLKQEKLHEDMDVDISKENAKVLKIEETVISNKTNDEDYLIDTQTKVQNISDFNIRNIQLTYKEYDNNKKPISSTESYIEISLEPEDSIYIQAQHKKGIKSAEVIAYSYVVGSKLVNIDLIEDEIEISNIDKKVVKDEDYDILAISDPVKTNNVKNGYNSKIMIKNISDKDIGSVSVSLAELNKENEYIGITYADTYELLTKGSEVELTSVHSNNADKLEIMGYVYDDINKNRIVNVNLKLNQVILLENK